jgi:hypothetical protein
MRNPRGRQVPGRFWLSCEEIRSRFEVEPETPSLKHPAKTFAPEVGEKSTKAMREKQTKRNASKAAKMRRGVASPSSAISLSRKLNEFSRAGVSFVMLRGRVWLGAAGLCQNGDGASPVFRGMCAAREA